MEIIKFNNIENLNQTLGGKGASLYKLYFNNFNVPKGFIISTNILKECLKENNKLNQITILLNKIDENIRNRVDKNIRNRIDENNNNNNSDINYDINLIEEISNEINLLFDEIRLPLNIQNNIFKEFEELNLNIVAVRSSANIEDGKNNAWAGIFDSFLNITKENLIENILNCLKSLYSVRAISYRLKNNISNDEIQMAVIIQEMIPAEISGVAFSLNPINQNKDFVYIEAGFGLGEYIVSGQITPDSYFIHKGSSNIEKIIKKQNKGLFFNGEIDFGPIYSEKQKLSDEKIIELTNIILRLETIYQMPIDVEFAVFQNQIYILQVRPITNLKNKDKEIENLTPENKNILRNIKEYNWGGFKNTKRNLFGSSLWAEGIRNPQKHLIEIMPVEDLEVVHKDGTYLRCFRYQNWEDSFQYLIETKFNEPDFINNYIDKSYNLLKSIKEINKSIKNNIDKENKKDVKIKTLELIELHQEINFYEAFINGLTEAFLDKRNNNKTIKKELIEKINKWRNDESFDKQIGFFKIIGDYLFNLENTKIDSRLFFDFVHVKEFKLLLENKLTFNKILEIIKYREENGYILLNLNLNKCQNIVYDNHELTHYLKKHLRELYERKIEENFDGNKLKGNTVFELDTKISGECIVINQESDLTSKINLKNKILITTMTTPNFIPYLNNVKGIITDNGGVICHAAIISREFNIPAIIGTEGATQIFKTGDLIEMNLKTGNIRKIE